MEPALDAISEEQKDKLKVVKVNVDENIQYPQQFGIMSIPNMILFQNGQPVEQLIGLMPKENVLAKLQPHLG
jgi:thioredoxin 1